MNRPIGSMIAALALTASIAAAAPPPVTAPPSAATPSPSTAPSAPQDWRAAVRELALSHFKNPAWGYSHCLRDYALARELAAADHAAIDDDVFEPGRLRLLHHVEDGAACLARQFDPTRQDIIEF